MIKKSNDDLKCYFFSIVKSRKDYLVNDALKVIEVKKRIIREILKSKKLKKDSNINDDLKNKIKKPLSKLSRLCKILKSSPKTEALRMCNGPLKNSLTKVYLWQYRIHTLLYERTIIIVPILTSLLLKIWIILHSIASTLGWVDFAVLSTFP